jgi:hypothetical protein
MRHPKLPVLFRQGFYSVVVEEARPLEGGYDGEVFGGFILCPGEGTNKPAASFGSALSMGDKGFIVGSRCPSSV